MGVRWRIRTKTFAHVVPIADGAPRAYAMAAGTDGPTTVLTFRAVGDELGALARDGPPFFKPVWFRDMVGLDLDGEVGWDEISELLTESYSALAPKRFVNDVRDRGG